MNCRHARKLMDEALDRKGAPREPLAAHLAGCEGCQALWHRLAHLPQVVGGLTPCPQDARERVARVVAAASAPAGVAAPRGALAPANGTRALRPHLAWACVALVAFALGHMFRTPEVVQRTVQVPVVREKLVRTEVPVYRERVVTREVRVPVVRTRVVYRDRVVQVAALAPAEAPAQTTAPLRTPVSVAEAPPVLERADLVVQTYPSPEVMAAPSYRESLRLARLTTGETGE